MTLAQAQLEVLEDQTEVRVRHAMLARELQKKALAALESKLSATDAIALLSLAMDTERKAWGLADAAIDVNHTRIDLKSIAEGKRSEP